MHYIFIPLIGAFIGYVTNYIAVKMLFHPKREVRFLFIPIQGVFPQRQHAFAKKLAQIVAAELISVEELTDRIAKKAGSEKVSGIVATHIERVIIEKLPKALPMLAMFLNPEIVATVKNAFVGELKGMMGEVLHLISHEIEAEIDVHKIVEAKVINFSPDKLEEILFGIMRREFRFIELIGGVLGFIIGIFQVVLVEFALPHS